MTEQLIPVSEIQFVKELYPRLREDDSAVERYRVSIDRLPAICVARGRVLVDGFHRWQAHRKESIESIKAIDLGNLTDIEILKESIKRNSTHGRQLDTKDKRNNADKLYRQGVRDIQELSDLLSITIATATEYIRDAKRDEKQAQKDSAWDRWLNCETQEEIAKTLEQSRQTINAWCQEFQSIGNFDSPPESRQHFDIWSFQKSDGDSSYFGKMPPQVVENLLWLYTEPGQVVVDPFAGGGTTIDVAKRMGRRVWASDLRPSTPTLPIHQHNILTGWQKTAPNANLIILDPPYWQQAKGKYSDDSSDLGNQSLEQFAESWATVVAVCAKHLVKNGFLAFIISPTQTDEGVVDHALEMWRTCREAGLKTVRRIIVPYQTQQATGQQVEWARKERKLLKLYRDLVVMGQ